MHLKPQEKIIIELLAKHKNGFTEEEISKRLNLNRGSATARCSELKNAGVLTWKRISNGVPAHYEKRKTVSGKSARVLVLSPRFLAYLLTGDLETSIQNFRNQPQEEIEKSDTVEILDDFHRFIKKWNSRHTETFIWNILRKVYDPLYREERTPLACKKMLNRLQKVTL